MYGNSYFGPTYFGDAYFGQGVQALFLQGTSDTGSESVADLADNKIPAFDGIAFENTDFMVAVIGFSGASDTDSESPADFEGEGTLEGISDTGSSSEGIFAKEQEFSGRSDTGSESEVDLTFVAALQGVSDTESTSAANLAFRGLFTGFSDTASSSEANLFRLGGRIAGASDSRSETDGSMDVPPSEEHGGYIYKFWERKQEPGVWEPVIIPRDTDIVPLEDIPLSDPMAEDDLETFLRDLVGGD